MLRTAPARIGVGLIAVAAALSSCSSPAHDSGTASNGTGSGKLPVVKVAYEKNTVYAPLLAGVELGYFKDAGVDVKLVEASTSSSNVPLVLNGQINIGNGSGLSELTAIAKGLPIRVLSSWGADVKTPQGTSNQIVAAPGSGIHSLKQLDGKKLGVAALNDGLDLYARAAIDKAGGNASTVVSVEIPFTEQVQALKSGEVAAVSTVEPFYSEALADGAIPLGDPYLESLGKNMSIGRFTFVSDSWLDANRATAEKFLKGLQRVFTWANSHPVQLNHYAASLTGESLADVSKLPQQRFTTAVDVKQTKAGLSILNKYHVIKETPTMSTILAKSAPTQ